jgi:hypothetical protein
MRIYNTAGKPPDDSTSWVIGLARPFTTQTTTRNKKWKLDDHDLPYCHYCQQAGRHVECCTSLNARNTNKETNLYLWHLTSQHIYTPKVPPNVPTLVILELIHSNCRANTCLWRTFLPVNGHTRLHFSHVPTAFAHGSSKENYLHWDGNRPLQAGGLYRPFH